MRHVALALAMALGCAGGATAEEFETISDRNAFVQKITGKQLTRLGVKLSVQPSGEIVGRAFGKRVTGAWRWSNGYFCRDLYYGETDLGPNCQEVKVRGDTVRFVSDQGSGQHADLYLR